MNRVLPAAPTPETARETRRTTDAFRVIEIVAIALAVCVTVVSYFRYIVFASRRLWSDEVYTAIVALQPTIGDLWHAVCSGFDFQSLFFDLITRWSWMIGGHNELAMRMPELIGILVFAWSMFIFVGRRLGYLFGLSAMILGLVNDLEFFSGNARAYGMLAGACGLGMVAYQNALRTPRGRWALPFFGVSLFLIVSLHAYALAALVPFGIAELVRFHQERRADWKLWACSLTTLVPLPFYWIPMHFAKQQLASQAGVLGASKQVHWDAFPAFYVSFFGMRHFLLYLLAILFVALALVRNSKNLRAPSFTRAEVALAAGFAVSPAFCILVAKAVSNFYYSRYSVFAVGGLVVLVVLALDVVANNRRLAGFALAAASLILFISEGSYKHFNHYEIQKRDGELEVPFAEVPKDEPIVIASGLALLPTDKYATDEQLSRAYFLVDHDLDVKYTGSTIFDIGPPLTNFYHFRTHIVNYYTFVKEHKKFFIYGPYRYEDDWQIHKLQDDGAKLVEKHLCLGEWQDNYLIEVTMPDAQPTL